MAEYRILHYASERDNATSETIEYGEEPISLDVINKLFIYQKILGVVAVIKNQDNIIAWELNNYWYSSEQIERMLKLKVFG